MSKQQPTLRDQFAMAALRGILSNPNSTRPTGHQGYDCPPDTLVEDVYNLADAMMEERDETTA